MPANYLGFAVDSAGNLLQEGNGIAITGGATVMAPAASAVSFPVAVTGLSPYAFNAVTVSSVGNTTSLVALARAEGLILPAGQTITLPGHMVPLLGWSVVGGNAGLVIGTEGKVDVLSTANVSQVVLLDANLNQVQPGATVGSIFGCLAQFQNINASPSTIVGYGMTLANAPQPGTNIPLITGLYETIPTGILGTVGTYALVYQQNWSAVPGYSNITAKYALLNQDPNFLVASSGPISGPNGNELVPQTVACATGTYEYGISPASQTAVTLIAGAPYVAPFYVDRRKTFTKIGLEITAAVAAKNIQFAVYKLSPLGGLLGAPLYNSPNLSTATAQVLEQTGLSLTLEGGMYGLVATTDATGLQLRAFIDPSGARTFGSHSGNNALDTTPYIAATINTATPASTWATSPAFAGYVALTNVYPQIWLRQ